MLTAKENDYLVIENKTTIIKFVEVYNLEVQDNENYFVTEDGVLVHNGYGSSDGTKLENDIEDALKEAEISYQRSVEVGPNGSLGEKDFELDDWIIEATVGRNGKLSQIKKYFTDIFNPNNKSVVLIGPNYSNSAAVKAIEEAGASVVHSIEDLLDLIK